MQAARGEVLREQSEAAASCRRASRDHAHPGFPCAPERPCVRRLVRLRLRPRAGEGVRPLRDAQAPARESDHRVERGGAPTLTAADARGRNRRAALSTAECRAATRRESEAGHQRHPSLSGRFCPGSHAARRGGDLDAAHRRRARRALGSPVVRARPSSPRSRAPRHHTQPDELALQRGDLSHRSRRSRCHPLRGQRPSPPPRASRARAGPRRLPAR